LIPRILLTILGLASTNLVAQEADAPSQEATAGTESSAPFNAPLSLQYEAMGKYPELARAGSPFHREYLARVRRYLAVNRDFFRNE